MSQEEDDYWTARIAAARRDQLETVRKAAAGWSALFTAVLGVFGAVCFATGLTGLADLPPVTRAIVRAGIATAVVLTLAATVLAGTAANSMPRLTSDLTVDAFRDDHKRRARAALARLRWSMRFGVLSAVVVVAGSLLVLFTDKKAEAPKPSAVVAVVDGKAYCGVPSRGADGTLTLNGVSLGAATTVVTVGTCA